MKSATPDTQELAERESDGLHVLLLWHPRKDALTVTVEDTRAGERFQLAVARDRALDAFYHPFAYASAGLIGCSPAETDLLIAGGTTCQP